MNQNLRFSGHETFICKQFWLKKGYDYAINHNSFNSPEAVSEMGVGKNMVSAISYWSKAFGIIDDTNDPTDLGNYILGHEGRDPYLEDIGSLWLLHYSLVRSGKASIYNLVFNDLIRERNEFSKEQLLSFLKRKCYELSDNMYNERTIKKDINVFVRNYVKPKKELAKIEVEEDYVALLLDLDLLRSKRVEHSDVFSFQIDHKENLPKEIFLYSLLDRYNSNSISFNELLRGNNSPVQIFCINQEGLYKKIDDLVNHYKGLTFSRTAGNEVLQISSTFNKREVLDEYYS